MQELLRLEKKGNLTNEQVQWFRKTKPQEELFDTQNDPYELHNLAEDPEYADKLKELQVKCEAWVNSFEDTGIIPELELVEKLRPAGKELKVAKPIIKMEDGTVQLSCPTEAATIGYQIASATHRPTNWRIYKNPFALTKGDTLKVVGDRIGYRYSEIAILNGELRMEN